MAGQGINIGSIEASLGVNSGNLEEGIAKAEQAIKRIESEINNLDAMLAKKGIGAPEDAARVKAYRQEIDNLASHMASAYSRLGSSGSPIDELNKKMAGGAGGARNFGQSLMQLGYMADDAQYGLQGVMNNIGPLVQGLGAGAGLTGAIQITVTAAKLLYDHWDQVQAAFGDTTALDQSHRGLEGVTKQLKELKEELESLPRGVTAVQVEVVEKRKKEMEETEATAKKMEDFKTDEEKKDAARYTQAVKEAGGIEKLADKVGDRDFNDAMTGKRGHISQFLTSADHKDYIRHKNIAEQGAADGLPGDFVEMHRDLMTGMEQKAKRQARLDDRNFIARGADSKEDRDMVIRDARENPADYGKGTADVLAGDTDTKKDAEKKAKQIEKDNEKLRILHDQVSDKEMARDKLAEKEGAKANDQVAAMLWPELKSTADRAANAVHKGTLTRDQAIGGMSDALVSRDMGEDDARMAARRAFAETQDDDPAKREDRLKRERMQKAKELGLDKQAESIAALGIGGAPGHAERLQALHDRLTGEGKMGQDEADETGNELMDKGGKKVRGRLQALTEQEAKKGPEKPEASKSEVYATSSLTNRVQSAISDQNAEPKKQTGLLEKAVNLLGEISRKADQGGWEVS